MLVSNNASYDILSTLYIVILILIYILIHATIVHSDYIINFYLALPSPFSITLYELGIVVSRDHIIAHGY